MLFPELGVPVTVSRRVRDVETPLLYLMTWTNVRETQTYLGHDHISQGMGTTRELRTVQAVETALGIIEILEKQGEAGVTELAKRLDKSKGTIHSHLVTLRENDYVAKTGDTYRLSLKYLELGKAVEDQMTAYDVICEELDKLAEKSDELAQFAMEEHGKAVYIYKSAGENAVQTASSPGKREYMHCISLGKVMLAYMPEERVNEIIDRHGLTRYTGQTITSREVLHTELEEIRERGYAFDMEERIEGIRCVAAPVHANGEILGALSISGPATRMQGEWFRDELPDMVTRSANVIEINTKFA